MHTSYLNPSIIIVSVNKLHYIIKKKDEIHTNVKKVFFSVLLRYNL